MEAEASTILPQARAASRELSPAVIARMVQLTLCNRSNPSICFDGLTFEIDRGSSIKHPATGLRTHTHARAISRVVNRDHFTPDPVQITVVHSRLQPPVPLKQRSLTHAKYIDSDCVDYCMQSVMAWREAIWCSQSRDQVALTCCMCVNNSTIIRYASTNCLLSAYASAMMRRA